MSPISLFEVDFASTTRLATARRGQWAHIQTLFDRPAGPGPTVVVVSVAAIALPGNITGCQRKPRRVSRKQTHFLEFHGSFAAAGAGDDFYAVVTQSGLLRRHVSFPSTGC